MSMYREYKLRLAIRRWIWVFIFGLVLSGITSIPNSWLAFFVDNISFFPEYMRGWLQMLYSSVKATDDYFPYLNASTDWLAFAHVIIATAFIGPLRDPVKNIWVIEFGMIACLMVIPMALISGPMRGVPFFWRMFHCSFGIIGIIPLYFCYKKIKQLEALLQEPSYRNTPMHVNEIFIDYIMGPLAGSAQNEEQCRQYGDIDVNDEAAVKAAIHDAIKAKFDLQPVEFKILAKTSLAYYLTTDKVSFEKIFDSLSMAFQRPKNAKSFFIWVWEVLFGSERYELKNWKYYEVVDDMEEPLKILLKHKKTIDFDEAVLNEYNPGLS